MAYEFVVFSTQSLLTHQQMSQMAENDDFLKTSWANYRRPNLKYVNSSTVAVEENTGTALESKVVFRDGTVLFANGADASSFRSCNLNLTADFTGATPQGGLHSAYTLTSNRWYHIYAVKVQSSGFSNNFVLVADELAPTFLNGITLFPRYGSSGFYYLGTIRYGDSLSNPSVVLDFLQVQGLTLFKNTITGNSGRAGVGIQLATGTGLGTLTYTYASGVGDLQIPENLDIALYMPSFEDGIAQTNIQDSSATVFLARTNGGYQHIQEHPASFGLRANLVGSGGIDINLAGFRDGFFRPDHNSFIYS